MRVRVICHMRWPTPLFHISVELFAVGTRPTFSTSTCFYKYFNWAHRSDEAVITAVADVAIADAALLFAVNLKVVGNDQCNCMCVYIYIYIYTYVCKLYERDKRVGIWQLPNYLKGCPTMLAYFVVAFSWGRCFCFLADAFALLSSFSFIFLLLL